MTQPYIGEIRLFGFDFPPHGWALCQGQLLPIAQNQALYALIGTTYGGNGVQTFALPDLRGKATVGVGQGPGLPNVAWGEQGGVEAIALTISTIPTHTHGLVGTSAAGTKRVVNGSTFGAQTTTLPGVAFYGPQTDSKQALSSASIGATGSGTPHENMQPSLIMNYSIALQGLFPSRN